MAKFIKEPFINREYSWLCFNERVLAEAENENNPLLERCKFLAIIQGNLDEFFMVRMGRLFNDSFSLPDIKEDKTNLTPGQQLEGLYKEIKKFYKRAGVVSRKLFRLLKEEGLNFVNLKEKKAKKVKRRFAKYFENTMLPLLNPIVMDSKHPLIHLENLKTYVFLKLEHNEKKFFGIIPVPQSCERIITADSGSGKVLVTSEDLLYRYADVVFNKYKVKYKALIRVTRNAQFDMETFTTDYETEYDFSLAMKGKVEARINLPPVRLELSGDDEEALEFLRKNLGIKERQCYHVENYFDYKFLFGLDKFLPAQKVSDLKYKPFTPKPVLDNEAEPSVIDAVRKRDLFLFYPYNSMDTLIDLLDQAAEDPRVAAIKITIYRLDKHSRVAEALRKACKNKKEVTAVIELMARFDEENNMSYASVLKEAGATIVYGVGNLKVHTKILMIVMKEDEKISYITHLGTGNYNEGSSRMYTDLNIITANTEIGEDAADFFRNIQIGDVSPIYRKLLVAPTSLKDGLISEIRREVSAAKDGKPAEIICKMNSLTDSDFIDELIKASRAGVKVKLIIRGICCLLPGVSDKTENITVKSIVGRFLEHSRVYAFGSGVNKRAYISSADLMTRNIDRRVEIAAPVLDKNIKKKILKMLDIQFKDKESATELLPDGKYTKEECGEGTGSQNYFINNEF